MWGFINFRYKVFEICEHKEDDDSRATDSNGFCMSYHLEKTKNLFFPDEIMQLVTKIVVYGTLLRRRRRYTLKGKNVDVFLKGQFLIISTMKEEHVKEW